MESSGVMLKGSVLVLCAVVLGMISSWIWFDSGGDVPCCEERDGEAQTGKKDEKNGVFDA